jgi:hypothetical protein
LLVKKKTSIVLQKKSIGTPMSYAGWDIDMKNILPFSFVFCEPA